MSKHTPGPWVARQEFANRWRIESHAKGKEYVPLSVGIACTTILEVGCCNEDTAANAMLFAAAPDMLEALQECEDYFDQRADADCDQDGFIPNEEMKLLTLIRETLGKAGA